MGQKSTVRKAGDTPARLSPEIPRLAGEGGKVNPFTMTAKDESPEMEERSGPCKAVHVQSAEQFRIHRFLVLEGP